MPEPHDLFGTPTPPRRATCVAADYVPVREDGQFACVVCGAPAAFGTGVNLRKGECGVWLCFQHLREGTG